MSATKRYLESVQEENGYWRLLEFAEDLLYFNDQEKAVFEVWFYNFFFAAIDGGLNERDIFNIIDCDFDIVKLINDYFDEDANEPLNATTARRLINLCDKYVVNTDSAYLKYLTYRINGGR